MESFGWIIRQMFDAAGETPTYAYLSAIRIPDEGETEFGFLNSQHNAELMDGEMKDVILNKLHERWPGSTFEAKELFWKPL